MRIRLAFLALSFLLFSVGASHAQISAHYINVGQGDSILLEFQTAAILIDAGGEDTGDTRDRDHLVQYLNDFFARRVDLKRTLYSVIISHPHLDHTMNLMAVFNKANKFKVLNFVDGGNLTGSGIIPLNQARKFVRANKILRNKILDSKIGQDGLTTQHLGELMAPGSEVDVRFLGGARGCQNGNNDSLVVLVRYKEASFLFGGDAEAEDDPLCEAEETELVDFYKENGLLDVDVYKVGHHGARNASSNAFLRAMTPEISVISAGSLDTREPGGFHAFQFGHPREEAFLRLQELTSGTRPQKHVYAMSAAGAPPPKSKNKPGKPIFRDITEGVYCTCWDGDIVITTNESGTKLDVKPAGL